LESPLRIAVPRERGVDERRVAATPDSVRKLITLGFDVTVETTAGEEAGFLDAAYIQAGAEIVAEDQAWQGDIVLKVQPPQLIDGVDECTRVAVGATVVSFIQPDLNVGIVERLQARSASILSVERIPRITRAQSMDALSSMANIAGYRSVIEAAQRYGSFFTPQFTAAGKVPPARVLVIGAGVAGLAAIGAARALGAVVVAFDTRSQVQDQVQSMGAEFMTVSITEEGEGIGGYAKTMSKAFIDAELALFRAEAPTFDIVITTALIPGKRAPVLWTRDMVEAMKPGSVIVDLAASQGGNCELTEPGKRVVHSGVHCIGYTDLTSRMPHTASRMYAANVANLLEEIGGAENWQFDLHDEIIRGCLMLHDGAKPVLPPPVERDPVDADLPGARKRRETGSFEKLPLPSGEAQPAVVSAKTQTTGSVQAVDRQVSKRPTGLYSAAITSALLLAVWFTLRVGGAKLQVAVPGAEAFLQHLTVFVLACVVGWHVIWNVTPALHTPLMSVTNAISGIIVLGGIVFAGRETFDEIAILGAVAILFATINIAGGFLVTQRMLRMFRK
jgi:H+-translocating NAD(P) transhydrogenase subunit alpha